jgi:hypothetical protein
METGRRSSRQSWLVAGLVALSTVNAIGAGVVTARGGAPSESTHMLWYFGFSVLVAVWLKNDIAERGSPATREYPNFIIFLIWPILLPYHLLKTRGVEGLLLFVGFVATYIAPYFVQLATWATHAS